MQRVLRRRVPRDLRANWVRYLALAFTLVLSLYLVISVIGAADTLIAGSALHAEQNGLEDGEFEVFVPLTDGELKQLEARGAEIERRKKQAAEDYRKSTEAEYIQKRDDINNQFLNEILNIRLKLQNAKTMRLSDEEIRAMEARLEELQSERGEIQQKLEEQWIEEIAAHAEESIKDDVEKLRAQARESMDRVKARAAAEQAAAQARNNAIMEQARAQTARRELQQNLSTELQEVIDQRQELEAELLKAIEDEVARLAVLNRLEVILLRRDIDEDEKFYPYSFDDGLWIDMFPASKNGAAIFTSSTASDLTDELVKNLKTRKTLFGSND